MRNIFAVHAYGETFTTDWDLAPSHAQFTHACASSDNLVAMTCYAEQRRAPSLTDYDHAHDAWEYDFDGLGF